MLTRLSAFALILVVSFLIIGSFDYATFTTWASFFIMNGIPAMFMLAMLWKCEQPAFVAALPQPVKGIAFLVIATLIAVLVSLFSFYVVGQGVTPLPPMVIMFTIFSVAVGFWTLAILQGWPVALFVKSPIACGLITLLLSYVLSYVFFKLLFNFGFMAEAPVYIAELDPQGLFNAWSVIVFIMTTLAAFMFVLNFDMWPLSRNPALMGSPMFPLALIGYVTVLAVIVYLVCVVALGIDQVVFMVTGPIAFIFGTIVVQFVLEGSLYTNQKQPVRGCLQALTAAVLGFLLLMVYQYISTLITGDLKAGAPFYELEIWSASALLGVTFPMVIVVVDFLKFWPFRRG